MTAVFFSRVRLFWSSVSLRWWLLGWCISTTLIGIVHSMAWRQTNTNDTIVTSYSVYFKVDELSSPDWFIRQGIIWLIISFIFLCGTFFWHGRHEGNEKLCRWGTFFSSLIALAGTLFIFSLNLP